MKSTPQLKRTLETSLRELQGMVMISHSRTLDKNEMDAIAKKQIVVEDLVKELKLRGVDTSKILFKKYDVGGVVHAYSAPQMAGNLTGGSWGATLFDLGGIVQNYTSPALLQFAKGGMFENIGDLVGKTIEMQGESVLYPTYHQITSARLSDPKFSQQDLFFTIDDHGYEERIEQNQINNFLAGQQVVIYNPAKGEYYAFKLRVKSKASFAKGGKIKNQYEGKAASEIWNMLSNDQRQHFLNDHKEEIEFRRGEKYGEFTHIEMLKAASLDWSDQIKAIQVAFESHKVEGQYAKGGYTKRLSQDEMFPNTYKNGGMPLVKIENREEKFDETKYKGILDDFDMDGLPNADDPNPNKTGDTSTVEQVEFSKVFNQILDTKQNLNLELDSFVGKLQKSAPSNSVIYARTKTPYSILNKLVSTRLLDEKRGLKDLVGTTIAFDDVRDLVAYATKVRKGMYGKVLDFDDYYTNPNDGYRAYHFIVEQNGIPIELQLKTKRMKDVNVLSHDAYKKKILNKDYMLYLTSLADQADRGNSEAQQEFSKIMKNKAAVEQKLKK